MNSSILRLLAYFLSLFCLIPATSVSGLEPKISKLLPRGSGNDQFQIFGSSVAVSDRWVAVGAPLYDLPGITDAGAVLIFNARTGRFVRRLVADDGDTSDNQFGLGLAIFGNRLVVGAPEYQGRGKVYVFDLAQGRKLFEIESPLPLGSQKFGQACAISGNRIAVGSPGYNGQRGAVFLFQASDGGWTGDVLLRQTPVENDTFGAALSLSGGRLLIGAGGVDDYAGAAYLYDVEYPGIPGWKRLHEWTLDGGASGDGFGRSLALEGNRALIGALGADQGRGKACVFDVVSGDLVRELVAPEREINDNFANSVAVHGSFALIGEPGDTDSNRGRIWAFDLATGERVGSMTSPDSGDNRFGDEMAICGNTVVVGVTRDDTVAFQSGAAYLIRPLAGRIPFRTIAKTGDFAPGTLEADFRNFRTPALNPDGEIGFCGNLMGPGTGGNRDKGSWYTLQGFLEPGEKSRDRLFLWQGVSVRTVLPPIMEDPSAVIMPISLSGPGVNGRNNQLIVRQEAIAIDYLVRTGDAVAELGGAVPQRILESVQTRRSDSQVAVSYRLRPGTGGVDRNSDTGILVVGSDGSVDDADAREGEQEAFFEYRQFFNRAATNDSEFMTHGGYVVVNGEDVAVQQVTISSTVNGNAFHVARQGNGPGQGLGGMSQGQVVRSFLGEGHNAHTYGLVRAALAGSGITGRNREGLWLEQGGLAQSLLRKGDPIDPENDSSPVVTRFLRFWPVGADDLIVLAKLRGAGVSARNDCAVLLVQKDGGNYEILPLLREGDEVGACDRPRVRAIQRVEVDSENGNYAIVASLTGAPMRNQALLVGEASAGTPDDKRALRLPGMVLRKGTLFNTPFSESTRLRSVILEPRIDRTGSGAKGLGRVMNENGELVLCLQFDNRAKLLVSGKP